MLKSSFNAIHSTLCRTLWLMNSVISKSLPVAVRSGEGESSTRVFLYNKSRASLLINLLTRRIEGGARRTPRRLRHWPRRTLLENQYSCLLVTFSHLFKCRFEIQEVQDVMVDLIADLCGKSKKRRVTLWWLVIVGRARHGSNEED